MRSDLNQVIYGGVGLDGLGSSYRGAARTRLSNRWEKRLPYNNGSLRSRLDLADMQDRAFDVYENNAVARGMLDTEVTNVVSDQYRLRARSKGADGKLAKAFNAECEDRWEAFFDQCDARGVLTGSQLQRNGYRSARRDGRGGFILADIGGISKLQHIPGAKICTPDGKEGDQDFASGVELDATLKPVAFHILDVDQTGKRSFSRVPANNFVHLLPELDDDCGVVGPSCYSTIFEKLDMLDGFIDGVGTAARMATVFGLMIKSDEKAADFRGLKTIINGEGDQQRAMTLENGMVKLLGDKNSVVQVDAKQPMVQSPDWIRAQMRILGVPFNMPLELVALDSSASTFATWRGQVLMYYRACYARMKFYKSHWSRIYRWWLSREQKRQQAGMPYAFVTPFPTKYWDHDFHSRAWAYTDPIRDPQSDFMQRDAGWKSDPQICSERGTDFEEVQIQQAAANAFKRLHGLPTDVRSTLSRDVITVRSNDATSVTGEDQGEQESAAQDKQDGYEYPDGSEDE